MSSSTPINRRAALGLVAGAGLLALSACKGDRKVTGYGAEGDEGGSGGSSNGNGANGNGANGSGKTGSGAGNGNGQIGSPDGVYPPGEDPHGEASEKPNEDLEKAEIPAEPAGPYPADGTNGPNALALKHIVRRDVRLSESGTRLIAEGMPLSLTLTIVDGKKSEPLRDRAVYLWQADRDGKFSLYSEGLTQEDYLRGVQVTNKSGQVVFETIVPGHFAGRWPHLGVIVFDTLGLATNGTNARKVTQLALPRETCEATYSVDGYQASHASFASASLQKDPIFKDESRRQMLETSGGALSGFQGSLTIGI